MDLYGVISPDMIILIIALHSQQPIKLFEIMLLYSPHKLFGDELIFARQTVRWESVDELGTDQYQPSTLVSPVDTGSKNFSNSAGKQLDLRAARRLV